VAGTRRAFTLLEVLLAVGLSLLLVLAIAMAIDMYRRMTTAAQDDLSEMRLVRAIFNKFEADIRAVVPPQPIGTGTTATPSASSSGGSGSSSSGGGSTGGSGSGGSSGSNSSSSSSSSSSQTSDPLQYAYSRAIFGLYGNEDSLVLDTLSPKRLPPAQVQSGAQAASQSNSAPSNPVGMHGDMKVISYFVLGEGASPILPANAGSGQLTPEGKVMTSGLARLEGDRNAIGYAMETSSTSSLAARIIAPEVQSIALRYFDGSSSSWVTSWSGATAQALPQAVEIVINIGSSDPYGARTQAARDQAPRAYRHVVAITTSASPQLISEQTINSTSANMSQ
jgi:type II secretory pathway component PulJ